MTILESYELLHFRKNSFLNRMLSIQWFCKDNFRTLCVLFFTFPLFNQIKLKLDKLEVDIAGLNNVMSFLGVLQNENKSYFKRTEGGHILNLSETGLACEDRGREQWGSRISREVCSPSSVQRADQGTSRQKTDLTEFLKNICDLCEREAQ